MRLYWELARRGFQQTATYRMAAVSGAITNTFFGFLRAYTFIALYQARGEVGGYDLEDALTFTFLTQGMAALVELWSWWRIADSVQSGQVISDLARPYDFEFAWLAQDYGRAVFQFFARSVPPFIVGALVFGVRWPEVWWLWPVFFLSLWLAVTVSFAWRFCLNLTAFWLNDYRGVAGLGLLVATLLSGFIVPLALFPAAIRDVVYLLPFASFVAVPIDIFLGKATGLDLLALLALQSFWVCAGLALGRLMLASAMRKLVIQGG